MKGSTQEAEKEPEAGAVKGAEFQLSWCFPHMDKEVGLGFGSW